MEGGSEGHRDANQWLTAAVSRPEAAARGMCAPVTHEGKARAGKKRSESGKEWSSRASDARSAGLPNLGKIGRARRKILPQLC